jgi:hypothetical protein
MNRSEKRRQKKVAEKSAPKVKSVQPEIQPAQQTVTIEQAIDVAVNGGVKLDRLGGAKPDHLM